MDAARLQRWECEVRAFHTGPRHLQTREGKARVLHPHHLRIRSPGEAVARFQIRLAALDGHVHHLTQVGLVLGEIQMLKRKLPIGSQWTRAHGAGPGQALARVRRGFEGVVAVGAGRRLEVIEAQTQRAEPRMELRRRGAIHERHAAFGEAEMAEGEGPGLGRRLILCRRRGRAFKEIGEVRFAILAQRDLHRRTEDG